MLFDLDSEVSELKGGVRKPAKVQKIILDDDKKPEEPAYKFNPADLVRMDRSFYMDGEYGEFTKELYPYSLNFYDFEVFEYDWLVVIINPVAKTKNIIVNNPFALRSYYEKHKDEIWVGYNSRNYDTYILKAILLGMNPKRINDRIIVDKVKGWELSDDFNKKQLYNFDVMTNKLQSLKQLEAFMGNDIRETTVPFDIKRVLNRNEIRETIFYCNHDVEQTIEVFKRRKADYDAPLELLRLFGLPFSSVSMTKAQLTARIIGCERPKTERKDEFDIDIVNTLDIKKYADVVEWFKDKRNHNYKNKNKRDVCGVPHIFGWGGLHGCVDKPIHEKGLILHLDVTSYYPSIMIVYDFLTRNSLHKNKFKEVYDTRVELKKQGKKKEQAPYKIILNATYGICKDRHSRAFDPRMANNVCINGQLLLLDLLEHLEGHCRLLQSNTDGLIVMVDDESQIADVHKICDEWMNRTGMGLGFDDISEIWQGDVNNYVFKFKNGKYERKGGYVTQLDDLNNDLPIVNEAVFDYLTEGKPVEQTVNDCKEMIKFQKIYRISSEYKFGWHNNKYLSDRTFRVFASKDKDDTYLGKSKGEGCTIEKFADCPFNCFIYNESVKDMEVMDKVDKKWYIDLAKKRLSDKFGISFEEKLW